MSCQVRGRQESPLLVGESRGAWHGTEYSRIVLGGSLARFALHEPLPGHGWPVPASHLISDSLELRSPGDQGVLACGHSKGMCSLDRGASVCPETEVTVGRGQQGTDLKQALAQESWERGRGSRDMRAACGPFSVAPPLSLARCSEALPRMRLLSVIVGNASICKPPSSAS